MVHTIGTGNTKCTYLGTYVDTVAWRILCFITYDVIYNTSVSKFQCQIQFENSSLEFQKIINFIFSSWLQIFFSIFSKLSKAKKSWQLSSECSCNTMIAVQGLFVSMCIALLSQLKMKNFSLKKIYFPCCVLNSWLSAFVYSSTQKRPQ